jgi:hypothetical protein
VSTVFDDFSGNTPPAEPAGWTKANYGSWTIATADDAGNVIATDDDNGVGSRLHFLVHTATGSIADASAQVLEVVTKWRYRTGETVGQVLHTVLLLQSLDGSSNAAYVFGPTSSTACRGFRLSSTGSTNTLGGTTAQSIGFTLAADTWYWSRWRRETDGIFRGRIWADGSSEPGTWQWEAGSADTTLTTGYIGVSGNAHTSEQDFDLIGIGLGESAPTSAGGGTVNTQMLSSNLAVTDDAILSAIRNALLSDLLTIIDGPNIVSTAYGMVLTDDLIVSDEVLAQVLGTITKILTSEVAVADEARTSALRFIMLTDALQLFDELSSAVTMPSNPVNPRIVIGLDQPLIIVGADPPPGIVLGQDQSNIVVGGYGL